LTCQEEEEEEGGAKEEEGEGEEFRTKSRHQEKLLSLLHNLLLHQGVLMDI
jgi:hypothetical protein